jgi:hypothetical protein
MYRELVEVDVVLESQGLVRPHQQGSRFTQSVAGSGMRHLKNAVLTKTK